MKVGDTPRSRGPAVIALVLRELLKGSGYAEWQLAHALDVDISSVVDWLSGMPVPAARFGDLAFTLGVTVEHMLERERYLDYDYRRQEAVREARGLARVEVKHVYVSAPRSPEEMLREAGMVRTEASRSPSVIYYCLSCNRGLGAGGTQRRTRHALAQNARRCHFCHGSMLAEECLSGGVDRQYRSGGIAA